MHLAQDIEPHIHAGTNLDTGTLDTVTLDYEAGSAA